MDVCTGAPNGEVTALASALLFFEVTSLLLRKTLFKLSATSKDRLYCCQFERRSQSCGETTCFIQFWTALSIEKVFVVVIFAV